VYDCLASHKALDRLLRLWNLHLLHGTRRRSPSRLPKAILDVGDATSLVAQINGIGLLHVLYPDLTEFVYANGRRKAVLIPVAAHISKFV
jgi:hypothetical protein